jgi:hypothetical protein
MKNPATDHTEATEAGERRFIPVFAGFFLSVFSVTSVAENPALLPELHHYPGFLSVQSVVGT